MHEFSRATLGLKVCVCTPCLLSGALLSPFAALSSAYFGDAVTDHVSRGSMLSDSSKKTNPFGCLWSGMWGSAAAGASLVI